MSSGEVGCITSHLRKQLSIGTIRLTVHMLLSWKMIATRYCSLLELLLSDFVAHLPYDWDVVQVAIIQTGDVHVKLHRRFVNDFSTACYMITRHHAEKLIKHHVKGPDKYRLDNGVKPCPVADDLIYNSGNTYSIPLLLYRLNWDLLSIPNMLTLSIKSIMMV